MNVLYGSGYQGKIESTGVLVAGSGEIHTACLAVEAELENFRTWMILRPQVIAFCRKYVVVVILEDIEVFGGYIERSFSMLDAKTEAALKEIRERRTSVDDTFTTGDVMRWCGLRFVYETGKG